MKNYSIIDPKSKEMITLQIGQCGNQLGHALFDKIAQESNDTILEHESAFFRRHGSVASTSSIIEEAKLTARSILIDMEPKVIQKCQREAVSSTSKWQYDNENTVIKQSGSGNNWAYGYAVHGTATETELLDTIQKEVEKCDMLKGFLTLQSIAGGTGSGLGSYLTEAVADNYPTSNLLNIVVWPYQSGEVIVQNYNACLTMASLSEVSNGIIVLKNDIASDICRRLLNIAKPSFDEMNLVLASHVASILLPCTTQKNGQEKDTLNDVFYRLCPHPGYKLLDIKTIPQIPQRSKKFSTHMWSGILKHLLQMQVANSGLEEGIDWNVHIETDQGRRKNSAIGSMLFLRGKDSFSADVSGFQNPRLYASWQRDPFQACYSKSSFNAYDKTATLLSNSKAMVPLLNQTCNKAYDMFVNGAFLHLYEKYGVEKDFFQQSFLHVDQIVKNYQSIR